MIYLDNAATTLPKPSGVIEAVENALLHMGSVGRSGHEPAMLASDVAYQCRSMAAEMFEIPPEQVVFSFNATHALNLAIKTLVSKGDEVVISGFEHNAVLRPLHRIGANITVAGKKVFDAEDTVLYFSKAITPRTKAVVCTHVSNVFGYVLPIYEIAEICKAKRVPLIIDAAQSAGILPLSFRALGAAFVAMPGHKGLLGPQGTGLLLCGREPETIMEGGTGSLSKSLDMPDYLPDRAEAGTQNIHGIAGLLEGMRYIKRLGIAQIERHEGEIAAYLCDRLRGCDSLEVFCGSRNTQSGVISMRFSGISCETVAEHLSERGVAVRAGFHCAPLAHESAGTQQTGTIRVSVSPFTKVEEIDAFCDILNNLKTR